MLVIIHIQIIIRSKKEARWMKFRRLKLFISSCILDRLLVLECNLVELAVVESAAVDSAVVLVLGYNLVELVVEDILWSVDR